MSTLPPSPGAGPQAGPLLKLLPLAVALWVCVCFWPAVDAGLLNWDDDAAVVNNPHFRGLGGEQLAWMFTHPYGGPYIPLSWMTLALDYELWGLSEGFDPPEAGLYHRTSVLLQALAALFCCAFARRLLIVTGAAPGSPRTWCAAALAGALFAAHPLRVESVAWITERRDVLSGAFFFLALGAYFKSALYVRDEPARLAARPALLATAAAALACALFFGSVALGEERMSFGALGPAGLVASVAALAISTWFAPAAASGALPVASPAAPGTGAKAARGRRLWYAVFVVWLLATFLSKALGVMLPLALLCVDLWPLRRWPRSRRISGALALATEKAPLFALSLVFGVLAIWGQSTQPTALASLDTHPLPQRLAQAVYGLWFYPSRTLVPVGLVPMVELPSHDWVASPRFWFAAAGVLALAVTGWRLRRRAPAVPLALGTFALLVLPVLGLTQAGGQLVADRYSYVPAVPLTLLLAGAWWRLAGRVAPAVAGAVALSAVLVLGLLTHRQTGFWKDSETLWNRNLAAAPESVMPHYMLGGVHYLRAQQNPERRAEELALARAEYERGLAKSPRLNPLFHGMYGALLIDLREHRKAAELLARVVELAPRDAVAFTNLGVALRETGRLRPAASAGLRAVELDPTYAKGWMQLAVTHERAGDRDAAVAAYRRLLELWPRYGPARRKLAELGQ